MTAQLDWAPIPFRPLLNAAMAAAQTDSRVAGLIAAGSAADGTMDQFSDVDLVVVCRDDDHASLLCEAQAFAARLGPLLSAFSGEHVREPRLLLCLYGPPILHVDLKFIADRELDHRVEDGRILWQRDDALDAALQRTAAAWPTVDRQWAEDRIWTWIFSATTKVGRGELFHCLEMLAFLRRTVFGPLIAQSRSARPNGVRRLEQTAPDLEPALAATIGDHTAIGCLTALHAAVDLYQRLRPTSPEILRREEAEAAVLAYIAEIESRLPERAILLS